MANKSLVAVVPYRNSKNNLPQVKLVVIEGAPLPERLIFQSAKFASLNGLNVGDEKLILWDNNGTSEYQGVTRPEYRYDVLSGGNYSDAFITETAKVAAKAIAKKFVPTFSAGSSTNTPEVVDPLTAVITEMTSQLASFDDQTADADVEALVAKARVQLATSPTQLAKFLAEVTAATGMVTA